MPVSVPVCGQGPNLDASCEPGCFCDSQARVGVPCRNCSIPCLCWDIASDICGRIPCLCFLKPWVCPKICTGCISVAPILTAPLSRPVENASSLPPCTLPSHKTEPIDCVPAHLRCFGCPSLSAEQLATGCTRMHNSST